jgi:xeroderma pigmentosum group C-complementing protein
MYEFSCMVLDTSKIRLRQAYLEAEREASEKARAKAHERVIKRWVKIVQGLRVRQRLMEQYKGGRAPDENSTADRTGLDPTQVSGQHHFATMTLDTGCRAQSPLNPAGS